ncbi:MAG: hypothetical protein IT361_12020 [Gemmatimonadaceae bacterium]|nr:hypothetical protein [Gemmatimonadaceae bacterium]
MTIRSNPPLHVIGFIATRRGDEDRGPQARMSSEEARARLLSDRELAWIQGPRRSELATIVLDDSIPRGGVVLRDIAGVGVSEVIRVQKPDYDSVDDRRQV